MAGSGYSLCPSARHLLPEPRDVRRDELGLPASGGSPAPVAKVLLRLQLGLSRQHHGSRLAGSAAATFRTSLKLPLSFKC